MRAFQVSRQAESPLNEKIKAINGYETGDLLYVLRAFEAEPENYEPEVIQAVSKRLYEKGNKREGEATADFISCICFDKKAEFAEKYFRQGTRIAVSGRIQTGSYVNREGKKVYTTDVIVEDQEFAEGRRAQEGQPPAEGPAPADGLPDIPDDIDDELPFR